MPARIGVLALQGNFDAHARAVARAGAEAVEVRTAVELAGVDGLIIPGGESSTMLKLMNDNALTEPLRAYGQQKPIFGTCAGAILLAIEVTNPVQESLGLMDMTVQRNAYGRQLDSRIVTIPSESADIHPEIEAVFIRAPIIRRTGPRVQVLASYEGDPVLVSEGRHLVATFHPELTTSSSIHELFVKRVEGRR
ncbi:MAG TPA: pyridoxal 5'-phosphate synthase glutaminase subunit PdxT [Bryobacteraceae bacterium]|nr:pyridoxal 5'-phosphate synthase glutaminase subunit PdxT [Bryobacteraceae bacterium]